MTLVKRIAVGLLIVVGVLVVSVALMLRANDPPENCNAVFDVANVRALAAAKPGNKPHDVRVEEIVSFQMPEALVRAGSESFTAAPMHVLSYQLNFNPNTVLIDTGMSRDMVAMGLDSYNDTGWQHVQEAMQKADAVYVTHEHADHMGGLFAKGSTNYTRGVFNPEQLQSPERLAPAVIPSDALATLHRVEYTDPVAVAPGVVLIRAPGHTPGSQWVFVTLQDGRELLLVGDTAWFMRSIETEQGPPALLSMMMKNNREANACQLQFLHKLEGTEAKIAIMPGHDGERLEELIKNGLITRGFI